VCELCATFDRYRRGSDVCPWWPAMISPSEYGHATTRSQRQARPSWCYGTPCQARAQQLAGLALGDLERIGVAERALSGCVLDRQVTALLTDASLCHGWAGVVQTLLGQGWERSSALDSSDLVHLYWDADQEISPRLLSGVLDGPKTRVDSGTTVGPTESLDPIWLRATATDPAVCRISAEPAAVTSGLCTPVIPARTMTLAEGDSIAYLTARPLQAPGRGARLGAIGHGPNGATLAERLCRHIGTWSADRTAKPLITIYPQDSTPLATGAQVIKREQCTMTVDY
jgi:hypothetical protein